MIQILGTVYQLLPHKPLEDIFDSSHNMINVLNADNSFGLHSNSFEKYYYYTNFRCRS